MQLLLSASTKSLTVCFITTDVAANKKGDITDNFRYRHPNPSEKLHANVFILDFRVCEQERLTIQILHSSVILPLVLSKC